MLFNIAQVFRQLGQHSKALFYYRLFISDWRRKYPDKPVPYEVEVRGHISELAVKAGKEAEAAHPKPATEAPAPAAPVEPAMGTLALAGVRPGAEVFIDGKRVGEGKELGPLPLKPGEHHVRVKAGGFYSWRGAIKVLPNIQERRQVTLEVIDLRTALLIAGISATALAAGFFGVGVAYNVENNRYVHGTAEADDARNLSVTGYAVAGGAAAIAVASWTVYLLHRRAVKRRLSAQEAASHYSPTVGVIHCQDGVTAVGAVTF